MLESHLINYMFLYISGHFLGNDTVIHKLQKSGYAIEHIPADTVIPQ